jgi:GMP synthase (glutamine-hydrolysing)
VTQTRVLVVEHQKDAGIGHIGERLQQLGLELDLVGPDTGNPVPTSLDGYDGLIVLGGSMGPTEDEKAPWLPATRELLSKAVDQALPTLGICLGAQLLATATGGHVRTIPAGPEVGLLSVELNENAATDPLLSGLEGHLPVVQWHWLEADQLPPGAELLASSAACTNQAYRLGDRAWGLQFHPEALGQAARDWGLLTDDDLAGLGLDPNQVISEIEQAEPKLRETWQVIADRFAELTEAQAEK